MRHLKLQRQNRYAKVKYLRACQAALDAGLILTDDMTKRCSRTHRALLDDMLTNGVVRSVPDPLFVCPIPPSITAALRLFPKCLSDETMAKRIMESLRTKSPSAFSLLPELSDPRVALVDFLRPKTWTDPAAWTFPSYGRANRVCLAAMVRGPRGLVETKPIAYAPCSGRLFYIAIALAAAECGVVWSPTSAADNEFWLDVVESLVIFNPGDVSRHNPGDRAPTAEVAP